LLVLPPKKPHQVPGLDACRVETIGGAVGEEIRAEAPEMGVKCFVIPVFRHLPDLIEGCWVHPTQAAKVLDELLPQRPGGGDKREGVEEIPLLPWCGKNRYLGQMLPRDGCGVGLGRLDEVGPLVPGLKEPPKLRVRAVAQTNLSAGYPLEGELAVRAVGEPPLPISQRCCA
jgi:hypothetical protein